MAHHNRSTTTSGFSKPVYSVWTRQIMPSTSENVTQFALVIRSTTYIDDAVKQVTMIAVIRPRDQANTAWACSGRRLRYTRWNEGNRRLSVHGFHLRCALSSRRLNYIRRGYGTLSCTLHCQPRLKSRPCLGVTSHWRNSIS